MVKEKRGEGDVVETLSGTSSPGGQEVATYDCGTRPRLTMEQRCTTDVNRPFESDAMFRNLPIPVIIVSYRNPEDVVECLRALREAAAEPAFDVYICENGGAAAFQSLATAISNENGLCEASFPSIAIDGIDQFRKISYFRFRDRNSRVTLAEAVENLGYAGAINPWLTVLSRIGDWPGVWILNPDTHPDRSALAHLVAGAATRRLGMVGSRVVPPATDDIVFTRGLRWSPIRATTIAMDRDAPKNPPPDLERLERRIDAVSGVSVYVTRACLDSIGPMDERYFLYFEDLEWGIRAKRKSWRLGYADRSIVAHKGGTTIGSARTRAGASILSVYLDFRNRMIFVRRHYPWWTLWTLFVLVLRAVEFSLAGATRNTGAALNGIAAAIRGEIGRPKIADAASVPLPMSVAHAREEAVKTCPTQSREARPRQISCRQIAADDLDSILDLLCEGFTRMPRRHWIAALEVLRTRPTPAGTPRYGYMLESDGRAVGVLLVIASEIRGDRDTIIRSNGSAWYVKPGFRTFASILLTYWFRSPADTYLNISPAEHTFGITEARGFARFADGTSLVFPALALQPTRARILPADRLTEARFPVPDEDRTLLLDHLQAGCIAIWCETDNRGYPFVFRRRRIKSYLPGAQLIYCRDLDDLSGLAGPIGRYLLRLGLPMLLVGTNGPIPRVPGIHFRGKYPMYSRGDVKPRIGDLAYTEAALFGL